MNVLCAVALGLSILICHSAQAQEQTRPSTYDGPVNQPITPVLLSSSDPWTELSQSVLTAVRTGDDFVIDTPSASISLSARLEGLNLGARSPDLPEACEIVSAHFDAVASNTEALWVALRSRAERAGGDMESPIWWEQLWYTSPALLESASRRLVDGYQLETLHQGLRQTICHDLSEPNFVVDELGTGSNAGQNLQDAFLMLVATRRTELDAPAVLLTELAALHPGTSRNPSRNTNGQMPYFVVNEGLQGQSNLVAYPAYYRYFPTFIAPDGETHPLGLAHEASMMVGFYFRNHSPQFAVNILERASIGRAPTLIVSNIHYSGMHIQLSGHYRSVEVRDSFVGSVSLSEFTTETIEINSSILRFLNATSIVCHRMNLFSIATMGPYSNLRFNDIQCTDFQISNIAESSRLRFSNGDWSPLFEESTAPSISFEETSVHSFNLVYSEVHRLVARDIQVGGAITVRDTTFEDEINFFSASAERVYITRLTGVDPGGNQDRNNLVGSIWLSEMDIRGEVHLTDVYSETVYVSKTHAEVFRSTRGLYGELNLWRGNIGYLRINTSQIRKLTFWYAELGAVEISGVQQQSDENEIRRVSLGFIGEIAAEHVVADRLWIGGVSTRKIDFRFMTARSVDFRCARVSEEFVALGSSIEDAYFLNFLSSFVNLSDGNYGTILIESSFGPITFMPIDIPQEGAHFDLRDTCPFGPQSGVDILDVSGVRARSVRFEANITSLLHARGMTSDLLSFATQSSTLGEAAVLNLRHSTIDSLVLPQGFLRSRVADQATLDIEGANLGGFRIFDSYWDRSPYSADSTPSGTTRDVDRTQQVLTASSALYEEFLNGELLPALRLSPELRSADIYSGEPYEFLRRSLRSIGLPDQERRVAIMQNDHYAETLSDRPASQFLYTLGRWTTNYGYDNGKAIKLLLGLWLSGIVVLLLEWILGKRGVAGGTSVCTERYASNLRRYRKVHGVRVRNRSQQVPSVGIPIFDWKFIPFYSADRTVPSLSLDEVFNRQASSDAARSRPSWVLIALYCQRFIAFIIVIFMVGGVLDVFQ